MIKSIAGTLTLATVLLALAFLAWMQTRGVGEIEAQIDFARAEAAQVLVRLHELGDRLGTGDLQRATAREASEAPEAEGLGRYYREDEWAALLAPGNLIEPRTASYRTPSTRDGGSLTRMLGADIPGLNRLTIQSVNVHEVYAYVNRTLARRDRANPDRWVAELAYRIEANEDFTEYRIWLRQGVKWHPPAVDLRDPRYAWLRGDHDVTAGDFAFGIELVQNPGVAADHLRSSLEDLAGLEIVDDHHFIVRWVRPFYGSLEITLGLEPLPRWLLAYDEDGHPFAEDELGARYNEHWTNDRAMGCGPYRFVRWEPGRVLELTRWDEYFDEPPPIERIVFRVLPDPNARLNELLAGGADYLLLQPAQYEQAIRSGGHAEFADGRIQHAFFQGTGFRFIGWNADRPLFADRRVRLAMTHALNRERLLADVFLGLGRVVVGPFFIDGPHYHHGLTPHPFDLERAADLLAQAGWVDGDRDGVRERTLDGNQIPFEFNILTYGDRPEFMAAMEIYKSDLAAIGVRMNIEGVAWPVMTERMAHRDFDAFTGGWAGGWDADPYRLFHSSQADLPSGSNRVGFRNTEADEIIETARRTFDQAERIQLFRRLQEILHDEQPWTFFFSPREVAAWRARVHNVGFSPIYPWDLTFSWYVED